MRFENCRSRSTCQKLQIAYQIVDRKLRIENWGSRIPYYWMKNQLLKIGEPRIENCVLKTTKQEVELRTKNWRSRIVYRELAIKNHILKIADRESREKLSVKNCVLKTDNQELRIENYR